MKLSRKPLYRELQQTFVVSCLKEKNIAFIEALYINQKIHKILRLKKYVTKTKVLIYFLPKLFMRLHEKINLFCYISIRIIASNVLYV